MVLERFCKEKNCNLFVKFNKVDNNERICYEEAFNKYFKPRVFEILSREENFGLIESAKSSLSEDVIAYIFYENYPNENWMVKFSKELIDNMVMNIPPTNIDIVSRNDSIYSDKKEE